MMSIVSRSILTGMAAVAAMPVLAQQMSVVGDYVLLSDHYGGPAYIGLPLVGRSVPDAPVEALSAKAMSGEAIATMFAGLCLATPFDRASYDAARATVASDFVSAARALPDFAAPRALIGVNNVAATQIVQERSDYGLASLWTGEGADQLKDRQVLRYSGSLVITGPVKPKDLYAPQCNLTLHVSGLTVAKPLLDGIQNAASGFVAGKRTEKPKYGYAVWTSAGADGRTLRITANAEKLHKPEQVVHITLQLLPAEKSK